MRTELLEAVARVITVHCWWVRVISIAEHHPFAFLRDGHLHHTTCRCITLEVTHSRGHYYVGHRWHIAEFELDRVLCDMRQTSPALQKRCRKLTITPEDVETLIYRASYGVVQLDMLEDDFVPQIYRH